MVNKELDRYEWMRETAQHLRSGELSEIDPIAVADWFDEVSGSDRREVTSRLRRIIEHRLKLDYVTGPDLERNRRDWGVTIDEQTDSLRVSSMRAQACATSSRKSFWTKRMLRSVAA